MGLEVTLKGKDSTFSCVGEGDQLSARFGEG